MKNFLPALLLTSALAALTACGGGGILGAQRLAPPPTEPPKPGQASTIIVSYVNTGGTSGGLAFFAANANGDVSPSKSVTGGSGSFVAPIGMAQDPSHNLYVLDNHASGSYQVLKYASGSEGGTASATIGGSSTGMQQPTQLAVDQNGDAYVADSSTNSILMFPSGANGNVSPMHTLNGPATLIGTPTGMATDPVNKVYVSTNKSVIGFDPSSNGNVAPSRVLTGLNTGLIGPGPLTFASDGTLFVETTKGVPSYPQIEIFTPLETQNVPPELELGGITTQLTVPTAIAVDSAGFIYVANGPFFQSTNNCNGSKILVYEPGANGDRAPIQVISGSNTQFGCITGLVVR